MEPVLGGRDDATLYTIPQAANGPQWSPSLADGTTLLWVDEFGAITRAAMEPVLGGRDDPS